MTPPGAIGRNASIEERRRLVAESLQVGNPGNNAGNLPAQADPSYECQIELKVEDIRPYEHNPRRTSNARFADIKESIRSSGVRNPLTVTRRPGEQHFIVEAGGNTRLLAVQQLKAETGDARFAKLTVLFRPWRSESHVLSAHLIENQQRGEMTFWDKANGVIALKAQLEAEKGRTLSLRQLEDELKTIGMSVSTANLSHYVFATERLRILGEAVTNLSGMDVKAIQPRLNLMKRYAQMGASIAETVLYATVFEPVFHRHVDEYRQTQAFSATAVCRACEEALAQHLGEPVAQLRVVLDTLAQSPLDSLQTLLARSETHPSAPSVGLAPAGGDHASGGTPAVNALNTATARPEERQLAPRPPVQSSGESHVLLQRLAEQVQRFAGLAGVGECLRVHTAAPRGYFMDAPPSPVEGDTQQQLRKRAWWLLASASGQLNHELSVSTTSAKDGDWREPAAGADPAEKKLPASPVLDAEFLGWLLDPEDEAAGAFWDVVALIRSLPVSVSRHSAMSEHAQEQAGSA